MHAGDSPLGPFADTRVSVIRAAGFIPGVTGCVLVSSTHKVGMAWMTVTVFEFGEIVAALIR